MKLLFAFLVLTVAIVDFKCLHKCNADKKKNPKVNVNCLAKCNKKGKAAIKVIKSNQKGKGKHVSELEKEVSQDEKERKEIEDEMKEEDKMIAEERKAEEEERRKLAEEDAKLRKEMGKLGETGQKLTKVQLAEHKAKLELQVDEHGNTLAGKGMLNGQPVKLHNNLGCMTGCLAAIHNPVVCKQRCAPKATKKPVDPKKAAAELKAKKEKEEKAWKGGCGPCYGAEAKKGQCCNTCADVKKAYQVKMWAHPLGRFVQCKKEDAAQKKKAANNAHNRIFKSKTSQDQHDTNKIIHKILFNKMARHTDMKGHFPVKTGPQAMNSKMAKQAMNERIKKWQEYRQKRWAGVKPQLANSFKTMTHPVAGVPIVKQQGSMLKMNQAQLRKWQMLKIHNWATAHKTVIKAQAAKVKKATLKAVKKGAIKKADVKKAPAPVKPATPAKKTPAKKTPAKKTPAKKTPAKKTPAAKGKKA